MRVLTFILTILLLGCGASGTCNNRINGSDSNVTSELFDENQSVQSVLEDAFVRNSKSDDNIQVIWNLLFKRFTNKNIKSFDVGITITKESPLTIGNILIKGIAIKDNNITHIDSLTIFGKKSSGSTGSIEYGFDSNITSDAVSLHNEFFSINLGYIMENQTIVSKKSFQKEAYYSINIYVSNLNLGAIALDEAFPLQIEYDKFHTFSTNAQHLSGLIIIEN